MNILVLTSSYPRSGEDIAGRFVHEWVQSLRERGHRVRVLCWADDARASAAAGDESFGEVLRVAYAPARFQTLFYGAGTPENLRENPRRALLAAPAAVAMLARAAGEIARDRPDIIVGHWLVPVGFLARVLGYIHRIPSLIVGHSGGVHLLAKLPRPASRVLAKVCASGAMTLPTQPLCDKFAGLLDGEQTPSTRRSRRPILLPMGIEAPSDHVGSEAAEVSRMPGNAGRSADWLCMGRLVAIKGWDLAIRAFLAAELPGAPTLHIAGDGPERAALEHLVRTLQGTDTPSRVRFHGIVAGKKKQRLLAGCAFSIFCSKTLEDGRHEGLPVSFLEAAAHGQIPLCADIPGLSQYVADPQRQVLTTRDPQTWQRAIAQFGAMPADDRQRLSRAQQARVAHLAWPQLIVRWERLLQEIAGVRG